MHFTWQLAPTSQSRKVEPVANKPKQPTSASPSPSWRNYFTIHPAAERFPMMAPAELAELSIDIKQYGQLEPITIIEKAVPRADGSLHISDPRQVEVLDGRNRLDAMEAAGIKIIDKRGQLLDSVAHVVLDPQESDPYRYVISRNIHRRHLTNEKKREVIAELIRLDPTRSDRQIAGELKVSPTTVGAERAKLEQAGEVSKLDTRTDAKGIKQPAKKPPNPKATSGQAVITGEQRLAQNAADELKNAQLDNVEQNIDLNPPADAPDPGAGTRAPETAQPEGNPNPPPPKAPPASPGRLSKLAVSHSASSSPRPHKRTTRAEIAEAWLYAPHEERARFINDLGKELFSFIPEDWVPAVEQWLATKHATRVLN